MARGGGGGGGGGGSKKEAGQARKAEKANKQAEAANQQRRDEEDQEWAVGEKKVSAKAAAQRAKNEAAQHSKAVKDALLAADDADLPSKKSTPKQAQKKNAPPSSRKLDLAVLDDPDPKASSSKSKSAAALAATNIDDAIDALSLLDRSGDTSKLDRHPERRFKAAFAAFEARRLEEMADDKSLRRNQKVEMIRKEFEKHPENPFNQVHAQFDSTRDEIETMKNTVWDQTEARLTRK